MKHPRATQNKRMSVDRMRIAPRTDPDVQKFFAIAYKVGVGNIEIMFGRGLYCDTVNRPPVPRNQIFLLRPAKALELKQLDWGTTNNQTALAELSVLAKTSFPQILADFRVVVSEEQPSQAFLVNIWGMQSSTKPIQYFLPKTLTTLQAHCHLLGAFSWLGPQKMIEPFLDFCSNAETLTYQPSESGQQW